jgi:hypothetical protein
MKTSKPEMQIAEFYQKVGQFLTMYNSCENSLNSIFEMFIDEVKQVDLIQQDDISHKIDRLIHYMNLFKKMNVVSEIEHKAISDRLIRWQSEFNCQFRDLRRLIAHGVVTKTPEGRPLLFSPRRFKAKGAAQNFRVDQLGSVVDLLITK